MSGANEFNQSARVDLRNENKRSKRRHHPPPFSLRLTPEQRAQLDRDAAGMSLGAYIRWRLFNPDAPRPRTRNRFPVKDHKVLAQLLGELGRQRLASNLNQLAKLANSGSLPVTPDTEAALRAACTDLAEMRGGLLQALGLARATAGPHDEPDQ